jgi:hypothetical protein
LPPCCSCASISFASTSIFEERWLHLPGWGISAEVAR